jgi:hypothetical protein
MQARIGIQLDRLRFGEWLMGLAALALAIDLIAVPWYSLRSTFAATSAEFGASTSATGLQAHHLLGALAIICAVLGLGTWCLQVTQRAPALPVCMTVITSLLSLVLSIGLLIRVVFDPPHVLVIGGPGANTMQTDVGAVIGVVLAWLLVVGAWISLRTDGIARGDAPQRIETLRLAQRPAPGAGSPAS